MTQNYWNCQGYIEPCFEFYPKPGSNKRMVEIVVETKSDE